MSKKSKPKIEVFSSAEELKADRVPREYSEEEKKRMQEHVDALAEVYRRNQVS